MLHYLYKIYGRQLTNRRKSQLESSYCLKNVNNTLYASVLNHQLIHVNTYILKSKSSFSCRWWYDFTIICESLSIFSHDSRLHHCLILPHLLLNIIEPETAVGRRNKNETLAVSTSCHILHKFYMKVLRCHVIS